MHVTIADDSITTTAAVGSTPSLWRRGLRAGALAAAATTAIAAVASAMGVSFESAPGDAIPLAAFAQLTVLFTVVGVVIAQVLRHRSPRARSTFTKTAVALTALSVVPDVVIPFDLTSKVTLLVTHLVAAVIVIPALSSQLPDPTVDTTT